MGGSVGAHDEILWLGILLITVGCFSSAIGMLFMKWSADVEANLPLYKRWRWALGFLFMMLNATVIDTIAYGIMPLSMIAPFGGLTIVFTALLASTGWIHVKESMSLTAVGCTAVVLVGVTLASRFCPRPEDDELPLARMGRNFVHPQFLGFAVMTLTMVGAWLIVWKLPLCERYRPPPDGLLTTLISAWTAAVCGALSQLFLKIVAVSVKVSVEGSGTPWTPGGVAFPLAWIALLGLALLAATQLYLLNTTLASSSVALSVPLYTSLVIILTVTAGGLFFREFDHAPASSILVFGVSTVLVMGGLAGLSLQQTQGAVQVKTLVKEPSFHDLEGVSLMRA